MFAPVRRQGDASGLEDLPDLALNMGSGSDALAVVLDGGLLQAVEVAGSGRPIRHRRRRRGSGSASSFWRTRARKEQKTCPRMAASQEW